MAKKEHWPVAGFNATPTPIITDHSRFGMLIVVRDYTPPIEETEVAIEPVAELPQ